MHSFRLLPILVASSAASAVHGLTARGIVARDLKIVNADLSPDGFTRSAVTAEGQFPAPLISANKNDHFLINVEDKLTDANMRRATSIHWHGLFQAHTPEMDGPSFVTQCPIIPNSSFLYNFQVPDQSGTYWYHSHLSTQYCDGLRGPLVIYDPNDPHKSLYDIDDASTVITLADWYHGLSTALFPNPNKAAPTPDSTLINGLGRWSGATGTPSPLAVVKVKPTKRHRFRIVSTSCFPAFTFSIDQHKLTVIETDGVETQPIIVDSIQIHAAQRYSVIVEANQPVANYWIRAIPSVGNSSTVGGLNSAILRYNGAPNAEPTSSPVATPVLLNEANVVPLANPGAPGSPTPGGADVNLNLVIGKDAVSKNFTINGAAFVPPSVPVLLQILSGNAAADSLLPTGSVYSLPPNKVIEVSIPGGGNHPFHLHGHTFDVVRVAGAATYNYANPIRRDTVNIGAGSDNVTFRFETNNPGPWFLHCHIDWHLEAGLAVVFAEDTNGIKSEEDSLSGELRRLQWDTLCPAYNKNNPDKALQ